MAEKKMKTYTWEDGLKFMAKMHHKAGLVFLQNNHSNYEGKRRSNKIHKVAKKTQTTGRLRTEVMQRKEPAIQRREGTPSVLPTKDTTRRNSS